MVLLVVSAHMFALPMSLHLIAQAICIAGVVDLRSLCSTQVCFVQKEKTSLSHFPSAHVFFVVDLLVVLQLLSSDRYQKLILMACQSFESASKTGMLQIEKQINKPLVGPSKAFFSY